MAIGSFVQDPTARLDYPIDWTQYLEAGDSLVATATARVDPAVDGVTVDDVVAIEGNITTVWVVTALTTGATGKATITTAIVTTDGRQDERSIIISIKDQ